MYLRFRPAGDFVTDFYERKCVKKEKVVRESFSRQAFMSTIGAEIFALEYGKIELRLPFKPTLTQQNGFLHAGVITSMMDSACGYAAMTVSPENCDIPECGIQGKPAGTRERGVLPGAS
jgi:hypothetical protein